MLRFCWLVLATQVNAKNFDPEACLNSFTEVASNAIARSVFSHCIDISPATEQRTNEEIEIQDPLTTVRKYCPIEISTKLFHSAFYEILEAGWSLPQGVSSPSRYNAIYEISGLCKKANMNHTARQKLGILLAAIYRDHLPANHHCLSMEDRKAATEDMETTLSKVRNIVGSINFSTMLYLKKVVQPRVSLELGDGSSFMSLKKDGGESGDGTAADSLHILLDKPSIIYMSQSNGAPNAALVVGEDNQINFDLFYRSILKDTTPGTVMFLISGKEFPVDKIHLVHTIAGNAQNQNILINVILLDPKYVSAQSRVFYQSLAMITGGLMYQTPRRAAHELIPIIESRFQPDQVTIVRNQRMQATRSGVYIDVPVDSTIAELLFEIKCSSLRSFVIYNPRYRQHRDIQALVTTQENHLYSIRDVEPGNWQVIVNCQNDFYVEVRGQSPVDFRFTFASSNEQFKTTSPFGLDSKKTLAGDSDSYLLVHSLGIENVELQSVQFKANDEHERVLPLYSVESLVSVGL